MPIYEYVCKKCYQEFVLSMTLEEYDKKKVKCPQCKSKEIGRRWNGISTHVK